MYDNMLGMGKDQWIKFSLNRSYTNPYPEKELEVYLRPTQASAVVDWKTAARRVAEDIYASYDNLYVAMSGGIDSEFVAQTFFDLGIPFKPIIFRVSDLNELDIWWAFKWCRDNNVEPVVVDATIEDWVTRLSSVSRKYCGRFGAGSGTMSFVNDYVIAHGGNLVTGAGFIEYFPDENLDYMTTRYKDSSMHNPDGTPKQGYLMHEPDLIQQLSYPTMPFNFLSWTPEIVLSYVHHRDMALDSAANKAKIMNCLPRPKNIGVPNCFFMLHPRARKWVGIKNNIGTAECAYLGTREELLTVLTNGVGNA
jgi:hypothetical protein